MDAWTDRLSEYLDGTLAAGERAALEAHLAGCPACTTTLAELRQVVSRAEGLEDRPPAADLWNGIAERIGVSPDVVSLPARRESRRRLTFTFPQLAAAAALLLALGTGGGYLALRRTSAIRRVAVTPVPDGTIGRVVSETWVDTVMRASDQSVAQLRAALDASRGSGRLDSSTVRVLEQSLATIDSAVAQARRALEADPNSAYLNQHFAETLRRKSQFLRRASSLVTPRIL
jgi:anti-sigma factor RsiW